MKRASAKRVRACAEAPETGGEGALAPARPPELRVGTSGWVYKAWRGDFYPTGLPAKDWLGFYATAFATAEVNGTFYRLPTQAAVAKWRDATPADFFFSWKASRFLTHMKRLRDPLASLERILAPMQALGRKLGPALFQLPPSLKRDLPRLTEFMAALPATPRSVIEFRDPSWYVDEVFAALQTHGVALCISDHHHAPSPWQATTDFVYVRGHGPHGAYAGSYSDARLAAWAEYLARWREEGRAGLAYFDNDIGCAAPRDAARLQRLLASGRA